MAQPRHKWNGGQTCAHCGLIKLYTGGAFRNRTQYHQRRTNKWYYYGVPPCVDGFQKRVMDYVNRELQPACLR